MITTFHATIKLSLSTLTTRLMSRVEPLNILNSQNDKRIPFRLLNFASLFTPRSFWLHQLQFPTFQWASASLSLSINLSLSLEHTFLSARKNERETNLTCLNLNKNDVLSFPLSLLMSNFPVLHFNSKGHAVKSQSSTKIYLIAALSIAQIICHWYSWVALWFDLTFVDASM